MSRAVDGDSINLSKNPFLNTTARLLNLLLCSLLRTAGGCFCSPTQTVKDKTVRSDVITTAYANQLCSLMGSMGFKFSLC